jgi:hypothetical protein
MLGERVKCPIENLDITERGDPTRDRLLDPLVVDST